MGQAGRYSSSHRGALDVKVLEYSSERLKAIIAF